MKNIGVSYLFSALISIILGVVYIIWPELTQDVFCLIAGAAFIVYGLGLFIYHLASKKMKNYLMNEMIVGLLVVLVGFLLIFKSRVLFDIIGIALGVAVVAHGLVNVQESFILKKCGRKKWYIFFLLSLVFVALGLILLFVPGIEDSLFAYMLGISLILAGIFEIVVFFVLRKCVKEDEILIYSETGDGPTVELFKKNSNNE